MQKYNLDILNLQETEIKADLNEKTLLIPGYSLETEKNQHTKRVASYISNSIKYRRRKDLEQDNSHMIILDIGENNQLRIINLYRPFNPRTYTEREFFNNQLATIDRIITNNTIIVGDFNIDLNKSNDPNYSRYHLAEDLRNKLGHHNLKQLCTGYTWSRVVNGNMHSYIRHVYNTL